jgi:hypothetical protein
MEVIESDFLIPVGHSAIKRSLSRAPHAVARRVDSSPR